MRFAVAGGLALVMGIGAFESAAVRGAADFAALDSSIVAEMRNSATPGAVIAVVLGDSIVHARGYGVASVETGEPVTPETLFRVASTTKMLVAAAAATLAEQGTVDFAMPISTYADGLDPAIGRLTLHQLLAHRAGLFDDSVFDGPHDEDALPAFVRTWKSERFFTEPDRVYSYSNPGYVLAGHVLAEAADTTFDAAMARFLFRPLGMTRSTTLPTAAMTFPHAQAHDVGAQGAFVVRPFPDDARYRPNGGVFTSALEFARFARAFVNEGRLDGRQAMPHGVIERLSRVHARRPGCAPQDSAGIAYGLVARRVNGAGVLQHAGARLGSGSIVRMAPDQRFALIILTNRTASYLPKAVEAITALAIPPPPSGPSRPPVYGSSSGQKWSKGERDDLVGTWVNHDPDLALELFLARGGLQGRRPGDTTVESTPRRAVFEGQKVDATMLTKLGPRRYAFDGQEIEAIPGPDGRTAYLHLAGRALARRPAGE